MFLAYLYDEKTFIQAIVVHPQKISIKGTACSLDRSASSFSLQKLADMTGHWRHSCLKAKTFTSNFSVMSMLVLYREDTA